MGVAARGTPPGAWCIGVPSQQRPSDGGGGSEGSAGIVRITAVDGCCQPGGNEGGNVAEHLGCSLGAMAYIEWRGAFDSTKQESDN